jgi:hypothetical protein
MGQIVFQATLGGQTALVGQNTASSYSLTLPLATDTLVGKATTDTLTNKTLTAPVISSIVNTGTLTLPTSTDTLVGRATTDTLTNKTLTSPTLVGPFLGTPASGSLIYCTDYPTSSLNGTINLATQVSGTLAVNRGGTGIATLTAGYIPFGAGTSAFNSTSNLFWDNTNTRLGIGTSSPQYALDISSGSTVSSRLIASGSSTDAKSIYTSLGPTGTTVTLWAGTFGSQSAGVITTLTNHPLIFGTFNQTNTMTFDTSGRLGIGTSSPSNILNVVTSADTKVRFDSGATNSPYLAFVNTTVTTVGTENSSGGNLVSGSSAYSTVIANNGAYPISFGTNNTERARIDSSGNLLVGTTSLSNKLSVVGPSGAYVARLGVNGTGSQNFTNFVIGENTSPTGVGSITTNGTTTSYNVTSDQRLKTNIVDAPSGNIDNIKVRSFNWIADNSLQEYGFIAQELLEVAPYAVHQPQDTNEMMAVDYSKLVPMMIKEIQDLKQRIATLENK